MTMTGSRQWQMRGSSRRMTSIEHDVRHGRAKTKAIFPATALFPSLVTPRKPGSSFERCKLKLESGLRPNDDDRHSPVADARIKSAHDVY